MNRVLAVALFALSATACGEPEFCEGATTFPYAPLGGEAAAAFPDDFYSVPDAATATGLRPRVDLENAPWMQGLSEAAGQLYASLEHLDGFGINAGVVLRFSAPVAPLPSGDAASIASDAVMLVELGDGGPVRVPFEVRASDEGATVILWPMRPLRAKTRHAVVVTREQQDLAGGCVAPSPTLRALLTGDDVPAELSALAPRYESLLSALELEPAQVSAAAVFTTGSIEEGSLSVARDIESRSFQWSTGPDCRDLPGRTYRECTGSFVAGDYTVDEVFVDGTVQSEYELPVTVWLPRTGTAPFPVVLFGHGLAGTRDNGEALAYLAAPLGLATVAIDAVGHGEHPGSDPDASSFARVPPFFGIDLETTTLNPLKLRDHLRASTWDKLQLVKLLEQHPTVGGAALDTDRMAYAGLSLGGIMGSELLALSDDFDAAILVVAGGRMGSIVTDSPALSLLLEALRGPYMTDGDVDAAVPVLQAIIDAGDPASYAAHVLRDRFEVGGAVAPHLLFSAVIDDDTVVNASNHALARALGTPHLAPVVKPVGLVDVLASGPVRANMPGGRTAAFFQFDRFTTGPGVEKATHGTVWPSAENERQVRRFLETWLADEAPEIIDPYVVLGTPPLVP